MPPLDVLLEYRGNGQFVTRTRADYDHVSATLHQGDKLKARLSRPRSVRQNAFLHALISSAFENQRAGPRFDTWKHLRGWLLIQAGHCDVYEFDARAMTPEVAAVLRRTFDCVQFTADRRKIYMRVARSVRFGPGGATSEEMGPVVDRVIEIICSQIVPGLTPEEIMSEAKRRAA